MIIEPRQFARERAAASGSSRAGSLPRLAELLFETEGAEQRGADVVEYRVAGFMTAKDEPALRIEVRGELGLRCQRCLERLAFPLALRREIVLVAGADEFAAPGDEEESVDTIPAVGRIELHELIEEEILLALPMAPRHPAGECHLHTEQADSQASASPFAALARLKL
jgi:uncharacterized protein